MRFTVTPAFEGRTVRDFLRAAGVSASLLSRLKQKENGILLRGERVTVRAMLHAGDVLELGVEDERANERILPVDLPFEVLAETPDYVAVNKPAGMPTHPSHGHFCDTLANAMVHFYRGEESPFCPRFINRLDRGTSGVVLVARHALSATVLSRAMAAGRMQKTYFAVAEGELRVPETIETGIRRRQESIIFRETCPVGEGDLAVTHVEPLFAAGGLALLCLTPETGRTHQLRVHLSSLGHPLYGDGLYGREQADLDRPALHAAKLVFPDPVTGDMVEVCAPLPQDLDRLIKARMGTEAARIAARFCSK